MPLILKIIVDYDLREDFTPEIIVRSLDDSADSRLLPKVGGAIDLLIAARKYCVGYHIRDEYHEYSPCPDRREISKGFQCVACAKRDVLNPCIFCNGAECSKTRHPDAQCGISATSVYLVSFGEQPKVGVSIRERLRKRWVEQGADWGVEIGFARDGSMARLAEEEISRSMGIPKSIRLTTKLNSISRVGGEPPRILERARHFFETASKKYPDFHEGELEPIDLQKNYNVKVEATPFNFDVSGRSHIKGEFLGMKGPLLFLKNGVSYVVDFRALRGRLLEEESDAKQPDLTAFM